MIRTKEDLRRYMEADKRMLERGGSSRSCGLRLEVRAAAAPVGVLAQPAQDAPHHVLGQVSLAMAGAHGNSDWVLNPAQRGLSIARVGPIVVSPYARIGRNCRIHVGVNIGTRAGVPDGAPTIGDDVYIGPGAKLFGRIEVADRIAVGANAVVNKSFGEPGISIGGVPAKKISDKGNPDYKGGKPE